MSSLKGEIALVTGASRGIGKGVAIELGKSGAVVYLTGRTIDPLSFETLLSGTISETESIISEAGGKAIAIKCDHSNDEEVEAVFDRIASEQGKLDILVNNAWSGYETMQRGLEEAFKGRKSKKKMIEGMEQAFAGFTAKFWESPIQVWDQMHRVGVRSNYVASIYAAKLMIPQKRGLIVNITAGSGREYWVKS